MRTVTETTAALRAAATDPHRLLAALAAGGDPALFDALLASTVLKPTGHHDTQLPVSGRFRGEQSGLLLRGLIALAPPESAQAQRLRTAWTGIRLCGDPLRPSTVHLHYLDRLTHLQSVHIEDATALSGLGALAAHPGLLLLSLARCTLLDGDLSGLTGARIAALRITGQHTISEVSTLTGLSGAHIEHLEISDAWKLERLAQWPDGLASLRVHSTSASLPDFPADLRVLSLGMRRLASFEALPDALEQLTFQATSIPPITTLPPLPRLHALTLSRCHVPDLTWLPTGLRTLSLSGGTRIRSLDGIERASQLVDLDLSHSLDLTDLSPLTALPALATLNIRGCTRLTDRAPLQRIPSLRRILSDTSPAVAAAPRTPVRRQHIPPAYAHATRSIRELLRSNDPDTTEQAVELVRSLCSPELVEVLLDGVTLSSEGGWQEVVAGRRFSGHRRPAALAFIAAAGVGESLRLREDIEALRLSVPVADAADLAALPNLRRLSLDGVKTLRSPEKLSEIAGLSTLILRRCAIPGEVAVPVGVRHLTIDRAPEWADLTALAGCGRLESVDIGDAPALVSVRGLDSAVLTTVTLGRAEALQSVSALADCPALQRVEITGAMALPGLRGLADHPALQRLHLHHTAALTTLPDLPALVDLSLDGARITALPAMPALQRLSVRRAPALQVPGAPGRWLTSAQLIDCPQLTTIAPLAASPGLRGLHLVGCPLIGDLSPLAGMSALERLTVRDRTLPLDLSPLAGCRHLCELDLRGCTSLRGLSALSSLPRLRILRLGRTGLRRTDLPPAVRRHVRWGK